MPEDKKEVCLKHPDFKPFESDWNGASKDCHTCCGLHYGAKKIGYYSGECSLKQYDVNNARLKIGPMSLEQFGHIRFSLGFDYHMSDGPSWNADNETRTIYFTEELHESQIKEFQKEYGCKISKIDWSLPRVSFVDAEKKDGEVTVFVTIGENNITSSCTLKNGMTAVEIFRELDKLKFFDIPNDSIKETEIE